MNPSCKGDDNIVADVVLLVAIIAGWIVGGFLFIYVFFGIRASILWIYYNCYLGRATEFDLFIPDPWCCSSEVEE